MRDEAEKRIGQLYPKVEITAEMVRERPDLKPYQGTQTDRHCVALGADGEKPQSRPSPSVEVPLASTFMLSTKKG